MKFRNILPAILISLTAIVLLSSLKTIHAVPADIIGAWEYGTAEKRTVMINTDKVFSVATYDVTNKRFISSYGGTWRLDENKLIKTIEWNSKDSLQVGKETSEDVQISNGKLKIKQTNESWDRLDDGKPGALMGAWIITGNFTDDKVSKGRTHFFQEGQ